MKCEKCGASYGQDDKHPFLPHITLDQLASRDTSQDEEIIVMIPVGSPPPEDTLS